MNHNINSLFWKLHLSWWAVALSYATLPTFKLPEGNRTTIFFFYLLHYGSMVGLTYLYRVIYKKINPYEENNYLQFIAPMIGVVVVGTVFFLINSHDFIYHYKFWETQPYTLERRWAYWVDYD